MLVKTESDGDFTSISIEDSGKHFYYEIVIRNNKDGSCNVTYENAEKEEWTLLEVDNKGAILIEKPTEI